MAVAYALKYPGHIKKLVLASPVGIPEDPYAVQAEMPEPEESTMANEFTQDQEDDIVNRSRTPNPLNARSKTDPPAGRVSEDTPPRRRIPKWVSYLWDANISPFSIVRWAGPMGPRLVSGWTSRRFSHLPADESESLHTYAYSLFRQRGSGEFALAYILAPGAFARSPLIRRIGGLGRQPIPAPSTAASTPTASSLAPSTAAPAAAPPAKETGFPVVMMYGDSDWMDIAGGYAAEQKLKEARENALRNASEVEKVQENGSAKVLVVQKAGHHLYLEGWEEFNQLIRGEMEETSRWSKASGTKV